MLGLEFADQKLLPISTMRDRHHHSVIFTQQSKPYVFSSASGSIVDRCSFGSDTAIDHQSLISQLSKDLVRDIQRTASPGPANRASVRNNGIPFKKKMYREEGSRGGEEEEEEYGGDETIETPPKNSLKECQGIRTAELPKKLERRRPASLDMNIRSNAAASSPRFAAMKKTPASSRRGGAFPTPVTPSYGHGNAGGKGFLKGSNSEKVLVPGNCSRRSGNAALFPFNSERSLPSKWEDAEKWILSPVAGNGINRPPLIHPQQRRPMSKSGPLGGLGVAKISSESSMMPVFDGGRVRNFVADSPFSAGVLVPDTSSGAGVGYLPVPNERCLARSASVYGCIDIPRQSSLLKDEKEKDSTKDAGTMISHALSRRDMGTQMSPVHSISSSPKARHSCSAFSLSALPIADLQSNHPSKLEVKDVQVDDHITAAERSKQHGAQGLDTCSTNIRERKKKIVGAQAPAWEIAERQECMSKVTRNEANIMAWENLQKAKAEAEIRKLEMKLEKMRNSSMDKIMNKLRLAQRKAQKMRNSSQMHEVTMTAKGAASFQKAGQMASLTGCFVCHAF